MDRSGGPRWPRRSIWSPSHTALQEQPLGIIAKFAGRADKAIELLAGDPEFGAKILDVRLWLSHRSAGNTKPRSLAGIILNGRPPRRLLVVQIIRLVPGSEGGSRP
jgi:hypothetical protein